MQGEVFTADIRKFRRAISVLKKQGILPDKLSPRKKLDARSVTPNTKFKGRKLSTIVDKYDDIVSGKATAVKVPASKLKQFRKVGFETVKKKVIVPHSANEIAKFKGGEIAIRNKSGIERIQIPIEFHNLDSYLRELRKNAKLIDKMKRRNEYFGIRFFGGQRANFYSSIEQLLNDLERYQDIQRVTGKAKQAEIYRNLEIIKLTRRAAERTEHEIVGRKKTMSKAYNRRHAKRVYKKIKRNPARKAHYDALAAQRAKEYRARLKGAKLNDYKQAAIRRALKAKRNAKKAKRARKRKSRRS